MKTIHSRTITWGVASLGTLAFYLASLTLSGSAGAQTTPVIADQDQPTTGELAPPTERRKSRLRIPRPTPRPRDNDDDEGVAVDEGAPVDPDNPDAPAPGDPNDPAAAFPPGAFPPGAVPPGAPGDPGMAPVPGMPPAPGTAPMPGGAPMPGVQLGPDGMPLPVPGAPGAPNGDMNDPNGENNGDGNEPAPEPTPTLEPPAEIVLRDTLDEDLKGVTAANTTDVVEIVTDTKTIKQGQGALHWRYGLDGTKTPKLSLDAGIPLSKGKSVVFWLRTSFSGPIEVFFEENGTPEKPGARYVAIANSVASDWQEIEIGLDHFVLDEGSKDENDMPGWDSMTRFGFIDATNLWNRRTGQMKATGVRDIWIDDFRVTTKRADNSFEPITFENSVTIPQDEIGDERQWVPINGTLVRNKDDGALWSYVRLANHLTALVAPVNSAIFRDMPEAGVDFNDKTLLRTRPGKRNLTVMFEFSTPKPTKINLALTEKNGASYSMTITTDPRWKRQRAYFPLYKFKADGGPRDDNGILDFAEIKTMTISDVGAQTGMAGANTITLGPVAWFY